MSLLKKVSLLALATVFGLAGAAGAQTARPTDADLSRALRLPYPILDSLIMSCTPGTLQGMNVQVCEYCATWLAVGYGRGSMQHGGVLQVRKGQGRITFSEAISYDQPMITPARGHPGVWVALDAANGPYMRSHTNVPPELRAALRYRPISGIGAYTEAAMSHAVWGGRLPPEVTGSLQRDPSLRTRLMEVVSPCAR